MTETNRIEFKRELTFEIFSDRIEITSAGRLPIGMTKDGMKRILQVYPKRIFIFMDNFIRLTISFYSQKGSKVVQGNSTSSKKYSTSSRQNSTSSKKQFLLAYCVIPRTLGEMMHYMNMRSRYSFINTYIKPLLNEGLLQYTIPE